jgi:glycosyltransferase involved in cell wall biosynthesis
MKITVISTLSTGGAAIAAQNVMQALEMAGHNVSFCGLEKSDENWLISLSSAGGIYTPSPAGITDLFKHWSKIATSAKLRAGACDLFSDSITALKYITPEAARAIAEADVINLHWVAGLLPSPLLLSALADKKIVMTLHDMNPATGGCHYHLFCRNFEKQCGNCPCLDKASASDLSHQNWLLKKQIYDYLNPVIITPSLWLSNLAQKSSLLGSYPAHTIIHPQDLNCFYPMPQIEREALRIKYGFNSDEFLILSGAQYLKNDRKNIEMLIDALNILYALKIKFRLILFGNGQHSGKTFPVHNMGAVDPNYLNQLYNMSDFFIHPAKLDALSLTLCEAQCCGTPVMSFSAGGTVDTFEDNVSGFLVKDMSAQAMANKIAELLNDRHKLRAMRPAVRLFAEKRFDPQVIAQKYIMVFDSARRSNHNIMSSCWPYALLQNYVDSMVALQALHANNCGLTRRWPRIDLQSIKNSRLLRKTEKIWRPLWEKTKYYIK